MSILNDNRMWAFALSVIVGLAITSAGVIKIPLAYAQNITDQGGNMTIPSENVTAPSGSTPHSIMSGSSQIIGSISVTQAIKDFLSSNLNVTLDDAITAAESQVNGTAFAAHLDVSQGFLVYTVFIADLNTDTIHIVVVDAGNGQVLANYIAKSTQVTASLAMPLY